MKARKKYALLVVCVMAMVSMCACGNNEEDETAVEVTSTTESKEVMTTARETTVKGNAENVRESTGVLEDVGDDLESAADDVKNGIKDGAEDIKDGVDDMLDQTTKRK